MKALLTAACVTSAVLFASPQVRDATPAPPATGTAQISGKILSGDSPPSPLRRVTMTLTGAVSATRAVAVTDDAGQFVFMNLPADRYTLSAAKSAYVPSSYGSKRAGGTGTPIVLTDGQRVAVSMTLIKGGVLTGTVRDARGNPLPDVTVAALRYAVSSQTGERELQAVTIGAAQLLGADFAADAFPGTAPTDDRGVYRIFGLAPGDYVVSASVRPAISTNPTSSTDIHQVSAADVQRAQQLLREAGTSTAIGAAAATGPSDTSRVNYAPVYHPNALASADATIVTLGRSEERSGIDVLVRLVPTANLTGLVSRPDGTPVSNASLNLREVGPVGMAYGGTIRLARSVADGTFVIPGVSPGRYELRSYTYPESHTGMTVVEVAGRDVSTSVVIVPGGTISGQVVFDGTSKAPAMTAVALGMSPAPLNGYGSNIAPDGKFVLSRIAPGKYRLLIFRPPAGWLLRSAMVNGQDASEIPVEIGSNQNIEGVVVTLLDRGAEISGRFMDAAGKPAPEYVLVVFSADKRSWVPRSRRTQVVRPDANGTFVARDLPAGDYFISAVTDLEDNQWNDPEFLAALAEASPIRITLTEGEKKVQDIRVGGS